MKLFAYALVATLLLSTSYQTPVHAGIFKCVANDGSITYSQSECPANNRTAKVLSKSGGSRPSVNCEIARGFIDYTIKDMRAGVSSFDVIKRYGGQSHISRVASTIINYVYGYKNNDTAVPSRIQGLAMKRCRAGNFGVPTCNALPAAFVNEQGGCRPETAAGSSTSSPPYASSSASEND